ncbi:MAG: flagellar hook protein FlgE [Gammaproteobacteria bacterium]|nr:flagellar hook protein FlgE [Gammaproteobacteria bacterium]
MPFRLALSGLNAASAELNVTANNIANVNTTGYKGSRAEFADLFAVSTQGVGSTAIGNGVRLTNVAQQFAQGNVNFTDNSLDLAINGEGFFTVDDNGELFYTRAGAFSVDRDGFAVNNEGQRLQVFPPNADGTFNTGVLSDLQLSTAAAAPQATANAEMEINLPANAPQPAVAIFDPLDPQSFNHSSSLTIFDSLGTPHTATTYFVKTATANQWQVRGYIDGTAVGGATTLQYDAAGVLQTPVGGTVALPAFTPSSGANNINLTLDFSNSSQFGSQFSVNALRQDGFTTGRLTGIDIDESGVVQARFTNGQSIDQGQVAMTVFSNPQGLQQVGDNNWVETFSSGQPVRGQAGTANFGLVQSGALEGSNVDLTEELVNMITAQRNFQANAQMISAADAITQTIINIR